MKPGDKVEFVFRSQGSTWGEILTQTRMFGVVHHSSVLDCNVIISAGRVYPEVCVTVFRHLSEHDVFIESLKGNPLVKELEFEWNTAVMGVLREEDETE